MLGWLGRAGWAGRPARRLRRGPGAEALPPVAIGLAGCLGPFGRVEFQILPVVSLCGRETPWPDFKSQQARLRFKRERAVSPPRRGPGAEALPSPAIGLARSLGPAGLAWPGRGGRTGRPARRPPRGPGAEACLAVPRHRLCRMPWACWPGAATTENSASTATAKPRPPPRKTMARGFFQGQFGLY